MDNENFNLNNDHPFKVNIEDDGFLNPDELDNIMPVEAPRKKFEVHIEDDMPSFDLVGTTSEDATYALYQLDLSKYKGKTVTRYTYEVTDYPGHEGEKIYANLIVRKNRIIAGDICSAEPSGFIHGFEKNAEE